MRWIGTILMRLLAALSLVGFMTVVHVQRLAFGGAEYSRIIAWHWPLGMGAFVGFIMLSLLLKAMGHATEYRGMTYKPLTYARYEYDGALFDWPIWARGAVIAVSLYSVWAFLFLYWNGPDIAQVDGKYLRYLASNPYDTVPLTFEEHDTFRIELQRGLTAIYLPLYMAIAVSAFFVKPPPGPGQGLIPNGSDR